MNNLLRKIYEYMVLQEKNTMDMLTPEESKGMDGLKEGLGKCKEGSSEPVIMSRMPSLLSRHVQYVQSRTTNMLSPEESKGMDDLNEILKRGCSTLGRGAPWDV
jgi:hypothetical protein